MRQRRAEARLLDTSGKPGQNHTCKFPCMWLVRDNFFGFAWTSGPITKWGCSLQHERTLSELMLNGRHYPSPDPARFYWPCPLPNSLTLSWGVFGFTRESSPDKKVFLFPSRVILRCVHRRGNRNASCSAGLAPQKQVSFKRSTAYFLWER